MIRAGIYSAAFEAKAPSSLTLDDLLSIVSELTGVSLYDLRRKDRRKNVVEARHLYFWAATRILGRTVTEVGRSLQRDHSTVVHGRESIEGFFIYDQRVIYLSERLKSIINNNIK